MWDCLQSNQRQMMSSSMRSKFVSHKIKVMLNKVETVMIPRRCKSQRKSTNNQVLFEYLEDVVKMPHRSTNQS